MALPNFIENLKKIHWGRGLLDRNGEVFGVDNVDGSLKTINVDSSGLEQNRIEDTPEFFEDTNFVTGDSPATLDLNTALGRNAVKGTIINDGPGNFTVSFSTNGLDFGDEITMETQEQMDFDGISVDSLRITWIADSAYRVVAI